MRTLLLGTFIVACLAMTAILDRESGVGIWYALRGDLEASAERVRTLSAGNDALLREIESWEADPSATDRAIREELDVALPGEVVVRFVAQAAGRAPLEVIGRSTPAAEAERSGTRGTR